MASGYRLATARDCARLLLHGGSLLGGLHLGFVTGRIARPVKSRRFKFQQLLGHPPANGEKLDPDTEQQAIRHEEYKEPGDLRLHTLQYELWREGRKDYNERKSKQAEEPDGDLAHREDQRERHDGCHGADVGNERAGKPEVNNRAAGYPCCS